MPAKQVTDTTQVNVSQIYGKQKKILETAKMTLPLNQEGSAPEGSVQLVSSALTSAKASSKSSIEPMPHLRVNKNPLEVKIPVTVAE